MEPDDSTISLNKLFLLFFTSFALLSYEIFLTRIISALFLKYFSILAISMAMAGLGIAGVSVQILSDRGKWPGGEDLLFGTGCALVGSLIFLPFYIVFFRVPNYLLSTIDLVWLLVFVTVCILPFFFGGIILSGAYRRFTCQVDRVYTADLLGAAGGTLAAFFALRLTGGFSAIILSAVAAAMVLVMISRSYSRARQLQAVAIFISTVCFFLAQNSYSLLSFPHPSRKAEVNQFERWSEMGLTTVARYSGFTGDGISEKAGAMDPHTFKFISHDYNSSTMAINPELAKGQMSKITSQISSFPFHFKPSSDVLVLGAGGGKEVYTALASGVERVTAVEFNRVIVQDIMKGELEDFSGGLYKDDRVEVVVAEARNYLSRTERKFDVIIPVMGSTPGLVAAGCYLFSTEYLQTKEAYRSYLEHLSDGGVFSFVCFFKEFENRMGAPYRVLSTIKETLLKKGLDPARHMMVVGGKTAASDKLYSLAASVLFSPSPFTEKDTFRAKKIAEEMGFELIYSPHQKKDVLVSRFIEARDMEKFYELSPVEIRPVTDDRPFYYDYRKKNTGADDQDEPEYIHTVYSMVFIFAFYMSVLLLLPLVLGSRPLTARPRWNTLKGLGYFFCLGVGFITLELTFMQKGRFLLGIPAYGFFATVFSFTVFMGLGGRMARKITPSRLTLLMLVTFMVLYSLGLSSVWANLVGWTSDWAIFSKLALIIAVFTPLGLVCGFPFVIGIHKYAGEKAVAWMWAVNAASATMGSVLVMLVWMEWGFFNTLLMGLGCYILAILLL